MTTKISPPAATTTTTGVGQEGQWNRLVRIWSKSDKFVKDSRKLLLRDLEEFLALYAERPDKTNLCGIRFNHAYALWITIRYLNPTSIIESGVNAGQSTYFMRNASSTAMIYAIDPLDKPICDQKVRWMDPGKSEYFVGKTFQDIQKIDWQSKIRSGALDPNRTLVFLDDHRNVFKRFGMFMKLGMRHIMLEDNYKEREGATQLDKEGFTMKQMFARRDGDAEFLFHQLISYAEFPPLVPPIMARENKETRKRAGGFMHANDRNHDVVAPILRPDIDAEDMALYERICKQIRVDPALKDKESYMQLMNYNQICYMELRPMA
eukprot:CAMPEP_0116854620 /NCGR_PEP_ID=MMETSP0418-20121206/18723_1 /TAXON_ID=1158023 /ORGANISM="Astrosyne radiata, Strain 13vi08-1A" /LENGTH=320 /DNA_ID=CAMNT_0004487461 /DNA_START=164 /DNA_END=1122 /DNA_ORIENTATION=-